MAGETDGTAGAPAAPNGQPQAGTASSVTTIVPGIPIGPPPTPPTPPAEDAGDDEAQAAERLSLDDAKKLRSEARSLRQRLHQAEQRLTEADNAKLSDQERLQRRVQELEATQQQWTQERQELLIRQAVERTARTLNLVDEDAAYALLDKSDLATADDLQDEVAKRLKALAKAKPWLQTATNGTTAIPATPRADDGRAAGVAGWQQAERDMQQHVKRLW